MILFSKRKDGGKESTVDAYFLFEIKNFMSVALLKFNKGTRENYHSHAFNALTWFLFGDMVEERIVDGKLVKTNYSFSLKPKYTPKDNLHKVFANKTSYALTIRGKWQKDWIEYNENEDTTYVLESGRKIIKEIKGVAL
jgi:hypothetical protein